VGVDVDADTIKLLGSGGAFGALLYLIYLVGGRIVAALDRVAAKVDDHTAADLDAHGQVRGDLKAINAKLDERIRSRTAPHGERIVTEPGG
jgi:hypothetical protein